MYQQEVDNHSYDICNWIKYEDNADINSDAGNDADWQRCDKNAN